MSRRVRRTPQAQNDIVEQAYYFAEIDMNMSDTFIQAVENAFRELAVMPHMGRSRTFYDLRLRGLRSWPIPEFPKHLIFYFPLDEGIKVIRVLHGSRDLDDLLDAE